MTIESCFIDRSTFDVHWTTRHSLDRRSTERTNTPPAEENLAIDDRLLEEARWVYRRLRF
jgi:hypothetical protein